MLCLDIESDGLSFKDPLVSVAFTYKGRAKDSDKGTQKTMSLGINHPEETETERTQLEKVQDIVSKSKCIVGHNLKFDLKSLIYNGIDFSHRPTLIDTQVMYWLYTGHKEKQKSLDYITDKLGLESKVEGFDFKKKLPSEYPLKELLHYNEQDTKLPLEILDIILDKIPTELVKFYSDLIYLFTEIEMNGIHIDEGVLNEMFSSSKRDLGILRDRMYSYLEYPINVGSGQQLSCALYGGEFTETVKEIRREKFKTWPLWRWKKRNVERTITLKGLGFSTGKLKPLKNGYWPTDKDTLLKLKGKTKKAKEYIELYRRYNKLNTMFEKFLVKYVNHVEYSMVHSTFNLSNTLTGRTSCASPNVQQLPRTDPELPNLKQIFTSRFGTNGVILDVDFSGAEWRHAAWRSQDVQMIKDIQDGKDPHRVTASGYHKCMYDDVTTQQRQDAKPINFRFLYGGTAVGFYLADLVKSKREGQKYIDGIYKTYPTLKYSHDKDKATAKAKGYLRMPTGRWYDYRGELYKDSKVLNYPNQGSSSDMTLACILKVKEVIGERFRGQALIVNAVHDSCILDCRDETTANLIADMIINIFTNASKYVKMYFKRMDLSSILIEADYKLGRSWGECG